MKKILSALLSITMIAFVMSTFTLTALAGTVYESESNDTFAEANEIQSGDTVIGSVRGTRRNMETGEIVESDEKDCYKFTLNSRSEVTLSYSYEGSGNWVMFIYDEDWDSTGFVANAHYETQTIELDAGTYYIRIDCDYVDPGKEYSIDLSVKEIKNEESAGKDSGGIVNESIQPSDDSGIPFMKIIIGGGAVVGISAIVVVVILVVKKKI